MATKGQKLGEWGEKRIIRRFSCPRCKRKRTLRQLPDGFKCVDIICDFCGYMAQVKTAPAQDVAKIPAQLPGSGWRPYQERAKAGIFFPLFVVLTTPNHRRTAVYYLAADLHEPGMCVKRARLSKEAQRAGWQGFRIRLPRERMVRLA